MGTTKILVVANAPGILQRMEETLAGLEVRVAIRLRDVARTARQGDFGLCLLHLGFDEQSTVKLVATLAAEERANPLAIVCIAPEDASRAALAELEVQARAAGAVDFVELAGFAATRPGNAALRERLLASAPRRPGTAMTRVLERATQISGGAAKLADHLRIDPAALSRWMRGDEETPEEVFLAAFELVLADLERGSRKPS
jgi:DNA-binding NtrC family response regulator